MTSHPDIERGRLNSSLINLIRDPHVLLIEDDPLVARTIVRLLRRHEIAVTLAVRPSEILRTAGRFDVGIFDIDLPESNGVELATLCSLHGLVDRVIFFSGSRDDTKVAVARRLGEFIEKREGIAVLIDRIVSQCCRPSGEQSGVASG